MNRERMDVCAILAEFGPASWCAQAGPVYRAGDGLGCTGRGPSWEHAAANLRAARRERETLIQRQEREHTERRQTIAHRLMWAAFALAFALAAIAGVVEAVHQ